MFRKRHIFSAFLRPEYSFLTRGPKGHCRSPEYNERVKNLTSEWKQKNKKLLPPCFKIIATCIYIRFVAVAFWAEIQVFFFKMGPPPTPTTTYFCPALDPPLGIYGRNTLMHMRGHEHFILNKFRKHPSWGSEVRAEYIFPYIYMH